MIRREYQQEWLVDSGANHSVTYDEEDFIPGTFDTTVTKSFDTANGDVACSGFGTVQLSLYNLDTRKHEILYHEYVALIKNASSRVLSVSIMEDHDKCSSTLCLEK